MKEVEGKEVVDVEFKLKCIEELVLKGFVVFVEVVFVLILKFKVEF